VQKDDKPLVVSLAGDLTLSLGEQEISAAALGKALDAATGKDREQRIFLRADKEVSYGEVMDVMNQLRDAGYLKVALVGLDAGTR
jgi:biopolymer transport protein ExbD